MLTNNFYGLQMVATCNTALSNIAVTPTGTAKTIYAANTGYAPIILWQGAALRTDYTNSGVCVGSGNTPAAKTDYKLENIISSGLTQLSSAFAANALDNGRESVYVLVLKNTTDADITISEVGLIGLGYTYPSNSSAEGFLVDRTVLDVPVTIPAGESKTISYTIRINYPA